MFENLQEKLQRAFKTLRGQAKLTEENIDEALRDFIDKKKHGAPRSKVLTAFGESLAEYDALYKELAK